MIAREPSAFLADFINEVKDFEDGAFEYFYQCSESESEYYKTRNGGKPFRALGEYVPEVIESPPGEGGSENQHWLVKFTSENDPLDVHYIRFNFYYNSWVGSEVEDLNSAIILMRASRRMVTVYEPM